MNPSLRPACAVSVILLALVGCLSVKTENEIKPIHITMDINLKVDRELNKAFADENQKKPHGDFKALNDLLSRKVAGIDSTALLAARNGASDDDRITITELNARRTRRFNEIARTSGVPIEAVQKRYAGKCREKMPAGTWYQDDTGSWKQK